MRIFARKPLIAAALGLGALGSLTMGFATSAHAQVITIEESYTVAARTLKMIDQQVQQLQNEAQVLLKMDKHLSKIAFPEMSGLLDQIQSINLLLQRRQAVDFDLNALEAQLNALYPRDFDPASTRDQRLQAGRARRDASNDAFRRAMLLQSQIVQQVQGDALALSAAVTRSQGADGSLAAQQATNQLLAIAAKQQGALQQMMTAQSRAEMLEKQRQLTDSEAARAATRKFLGSGTAYTPR